MIHGILSQDSGNTNCDEKRDYVTGTRTRVRDDASERPEAVVGFPHLCYFSQASCSRDTHRRDVRLLPRHALRGSSSALRGKRNHFSNLALEQSVIHWL